MIARREFYKKDAFAVDEGERSICIHLNRQKITIMAFHKEIRRGFECEDFTFDELYRVLRRAINSKTRHMKKP